MDLEDISNLIMVSFMFVGSVMIGIMLKMIPLRGFLESIVSMCLVVWWMWCGFCFAIVLTDKEGDSVINGRFRKNGENIECDML